MDCASAVCVQRNIAPGSTSAQFKFALAWDNPVVRFGAGRGYLRYYTRFFGSSGLSAPSIAAYALSQVDEWNHQIEEWQQSIVENDTLPEYYRHLLFNELYYLVDGGTVWIESEPFGSTEGQAKDTSRSYPVVEDTKWDRLLSHQEIRNNSDIGATHEDLIAALDVQSHLQVTRVTARMRANDETVKKCEVIFRDKF